MAESAGFTWGWSREFDAGYLHQRIFGTLVQLATPVVKEFHSDLFHDATWIREHVTGPVTFWYVVRHSGTHIGSDEKIIRYAMELNKESRLYRCDLTVDADEWTFAAMLVNKTAAQVLREAGQDFDAHVLEAFDNVKDNS